MKQAPRAAVRRAIETAAGSEQPDVSRLLLRVPAIVARAREQRADVAPLDPLSAVIPLARQAIPGLAAVALVLVLVAGFVGRSESVSVTASATEVDDVLLDGLETTGSDVLLDALTERSADRG